MQLVDLPTELLAMLPAYLRNIEDFNNARSTCRTLRRVLEDTRPNTILRLAAASTPVFFSPHPHFLVMATARQVSDWAIGDEEKTAELNRAFQGGIDGLYDLCVEKAGLTMSDIRRLHLARFDVINPLEDKIDKMAGRQWYATPKFWNGGVSEPFTIETESSRATFQLIIWGELFGSTMRAHLEPQKNIPRFDRATRVEFIKYCVPDWVCQEGSAELAVLPTGPYRKGRTEKVEGDQVALRYIVRCGRWKRLWRVVTDQIGPDFEDERRTKMWWNAIMALGLEGMELVTLEDKNGRLKTHGLSDKWKGRLRTIYDQAQALGEESLALCGTEEFWRRPKPPPAKNDMPPFLEQELFVCCMAMWFR